MVEAQAGLKFAFSKTSSVSFLRKVLALCSFMWSIFPWFSSLIESKIKLMTVVLDLFLGKIFVVWILNRVIWICCRACNMEIDWVYLLYISVIMLGSICWVLDAYIVCLWNKHKWVLDAFWNGQEYVDP